MRSICIGGIGCICRPKCHWMVIVVNLVKQTWFFLYDAACWWGFVYDISVSGIVALAAISAPGYKALQAFYRYFCPFIQQNLRLLYISRTVFALLISGWLHYHRHLSYILDTPMQENMQHFRKTRINFDHIFNIQLRVSVLQSNVLVVPTYYLLI